MTIFRDAHPVILNGFNQETDEYGQHKMEMTSEHIIRMAIYKNVPNSVENPTFTHQTAIGVSDSYVPDAMRIIDGEDIYDIARIQKINGRRWQYSLNKVNG